MYLCRICRKSSLPCWEGEKEKIGRRDWGQRVKTGGIGTKGCVEELRRGKDSSIVCSLWRRPTLRLQLFRANSQPIWIIAHFLKEKRKKKISTKAYVSSIHKYVLKREEGSLPRCCWKKLDNKDCIACVLRDLINQRGASLSLHTSGGKRPLKLQCEAVACAHDQRQGSTWQNKERNPICGALNDQAERWEQCVTPGQSIEHRYSVKQLTAYPRAGVCATPAAVIGGCCDR